MGSEHMDYKQHNKTYSGFMTGLKWGIPLSLAMFLLVIMLTNGH
jgi:hypothetical protein